MLPFGINSCDHLRVQFLGWPHSILTLSYILCVCCAPGAIPFSFFVRLSFFVNLMFVQLGQKLLVLLHRSEQVVEKTRLVE